MVSEGTVYLNGKKPIPDLNSVEDVAHRMTGETSFLGNNGKSWSSEKLALKNYRHARLQTLRRYRNKPCPQLVRKHLAHLPEIQGWDQDEPLGRAVVLSG